jgi:hypothetical protein
VHAVLVPDRAGWRTSRGLAAPPNPALVSLPPYAPAPNPVEKLRRFPRERLLSHRVVGDLDAVIDASCSAWNRLVAGPGRVALLTRFPWLVASVGTS